MGYLLYSLTFAVIIVGTLLYVTRAHWQHLLPIIPTGDYLYARLPFHHRSSNAYADDDDATFADDVEAGLSSDTFDLRANNIAAGDGRAGLDGAAKAAILQIMKKRRMRFDQARKVYMEQRFSANGIGPDGRPRDPKFVSFS